MAGDLTEAEPIVVKGERLTSWESFLLAMGRESFKNTVATLNDVLQKLVVLDTALIGGFVGIKELPMPEWARLFAGMSIVISLVLAFRGVYPVKWGPRLNSPEEIRDTDVAIANRKAWFLKWAAIALIAGFVCGFTGVAYRVFCSPPSEVVPYIPYAT